MTETQIIETARFLAQSVSGWNRYVRVNDSIVDTIDLKIVAMAWPRMAKGAFPIRCRGDSVAETLS